MCKSPRRARLLLAALSALSLILPIRVLAAGWPDSNDSMFPAAPSARPFITFDSRGFLIHGKRTFIVAGDVHYSRIPRAEWRDRLLRVKRAGYNTIQTYAFWSYHEPQEGKFDFSGDKDLNAYLQLIHSLGMYAIVRIGPYVNAEWDSGGLPVWLRFKPGLLPMTDNAPFYAAVDPYLRRLLPIVVANQITRGGPVIMVQLENENTHGGGTDLPDDYYRKFQAKVLRAGVTVPYFFSGLNHNDDPIGDDPLDTSRRTSPWYSSEFWTGWYGRYGVEPWRSRKLERATWKVIAYGGAGYTHYMMAGGSNFDFWNCDQAAADYDFGSPIGQAGDLRDDYYGFRRSALFATSFPAVLTNSVATDGGGAATNPQVRVTSRKCPAGSILFLDNNGGTPQPVQIKDAGGRLSPAAGPVTLAPGEIMPVVWDYPLLPGVRLKRAAARVLGVTTQEATTTLVIYGTPGEPAEMHFGASAVRILQAPRRAGASLRLEVGGVALKTVFPTTGPDIFTFRAGAQEVRVLCESADMADRTWFIPVGGRTEIVCGPDYVGEAREQGGRLVLDTERPGLTMSPARPSIVFGPDAARPLLPAPPPRAVPAPATPPVIGPWTVNAAVPQAQPGYNDARWMGSDQPRQMGADGDYGAYAWYRTTVTPPAAGPYSLNISDAGDWLTVFVNGKRQSSTEVQMRYENPVARSLIVNLSAGPNVIALLAVHYGRNKLVDYYGPIDTIASKGISGTVTLTQGAVQTRAITSFRWMADDSGASDAATMAAPSLDATGKAWQDADTSTDVFHGRVGYAWFRTTLPDVTGPHRRLHLNSIDDTGTVYLNGKKIADNVGVNAGIDVPLDSAWKEGGPNVLAILVLNTGGQGGLLGGISLTGGTRDGRELRGWRMRGGEAVPAADDPAWRPLAPGAGAGVPAFYRAEFTATPPGVVGPHPILRLTTDGLSRGSVWLNGHNLGRYPDRSPVGGIYLQECWLNPGRNTVTILDDEGSAPSQVRIVVEQAASRLDEVLATRG